MDRTEFDASAEIAEMLHGWLKAETETSHGGKNIVLDDWNRFYADLALPWEDDTNVNAQKGKSHYDRLRDWTEAAQTDPTLLAVDSFMSRQIACAQMYISGAFRRQCFLESSSPEEYEELRFGGEKAVGIDLSGTVERELACLANRTPNSDVRIPADCLLGITERANGATYAAAQYVNTNGLRDRGRYISGSVTMMLSAQETWTKLTVDHIVYAAQERDYKLASVPFREPKSISEAEVYYPFAD